MIESVQVVVDDNIKRFDSASLPLSIGVGDEALLQLPDGADGIHAFIGLAEGVPFLQAAGSHTVFYNNERVTSSRWLYDGDIIYFGSSRIRCHLSESELRLNVHRLHTQPPPQVEASQLSIVPQAKDAPLRGLRGGSKFRKYLWVSMTVVFFGLVLLGGFVFTAKSVAIRISPKPDDMAVSGGWMQFKLATRYLLQSGDYTLTAERKGYQPLNKDFTVTDEQNQMVTFAMQPLPGYLQIRVQPEIPFEFFVDDKKTESTSDEPVALSRGSHQIRIEANRYRPVEQQIQITGAGETQELALTLQPAWAEVRIDSDPQGAEIRVDDKVVGTTPAELELIEGERVLSLSREGFARWDHGLTIVAGESQDLGRVKLPEADGKLILTSEPRGADVTVDRVYQGQTPLEIELDSGQSHELILSHQGYDSLTQTVSLQPAEQKKLFLELKTELGVLVLKMHPADAEVYLDGARIPVPVKDGQLTLSTEEHVLEFRREGYLPKREKVKPRAGLAKEISIHLQPEDGAPADAGEREEPQSQATDEQITNAVGQIFRLQLPGQFLMGSDRREQGRRRNEMQQLVKLTQPYYLALKEVTNADFQKFNPEHRSGSARGRALTAPDQPVVSVSWQQAAAYCNWVSEQSGLPPAYRKQGDKLVLVQPPTSGYRMPTEAEWVWAARYASRSAAPTYPWGQAYPPVSVTGNYADKTAMGLVPGAMPDYNDGYAVAAPVASFKANRLGFYDLDGNVAEWMNDVYEVRTGQSSQAEIDPLGPAQGDIHTVRGGSWYLGSLSNLRWAYRDYAKKPRIDLGFRLARYVK